MSKILYIDELHRHVNALDALLSDPQPGLASWCQMYGKRMQAISDFWTSKDKDATKDYAVKSDEYGMWWDFDMPGWRTDMAPTCFVTKEKAHRLAAMTGATVVYFDPVFDPVLGGLT